jgi:hypothetical protein
MTKRWKRRPQGATWGDFGDSDQLGRLNLLTREKVLQGIAEVQEGIIFSLSLPLDLPGGNVLNPSRNPPVLQANVHDGTPIFLHEFTREYNTTDVACDDRVTMSLQYSTQWDSLAHIGSRFDADEDGVAEIVFYNGYRSSDFIHPNNSLDGSSCAIRLGIENMAEHGVQGRGVMIDARHHHGDRRQSLGYDQLMRICDLDRVEISKGDMLCVHTGFADLVLRMGGKPDAKRLAESCSVLDGHDPLLLKWIDQIGISVLIADNYAVEERPYEFRGDGKRPLLPLHEHCLFKLGVHLGELWYLTDLAKWLRVHSRSRFMLTAPPLRLPGAVGSPLNPIATV